MADRVSDGAPDTNSLLSLWAMAARPPNELTNEKLKSVEIAGKVGAEEMFCKLDCEFGIAVVTPVCQLPVFC